MAYKDRSKEKRSFKKGEWYSIDELGLFLPGAVLANMFRKPFPEEKTPDGFASEEYSDWDMCVQSFSITIICDYNATERTDDGH